MIDLWPDDISSHTDLKAPVTILKEQGALLGRKTNYLVEGVTIGHSDIQGNVFRFAFLLTAPALSSYTYRLLGIKHSIELYPLTIDTDPDILKELHGKMINENDELVADSEDRFMEILKAIFAAKKVRRVIEAIIAQSEVRESNAR